jgi:hypothetical protein
MHSVSMSVPGKWAGESNSATEPAPFFNIKPGLGFLCAKGAAITTNVQRGKMMGEADEQAVACAREGFWLSTDSGNSFITRDLVFDSLCKINEFERMNVSENRSPELSAVGTPATAVLMDSRDSFAGAV